MLLTRVDRTAFERDGFLVIEGAVDAATCARLRGRAEARVAAEDPTSLGGIFASGERANDAWFMESGEAIRCFLEAGAVDAEGRLDRPLARAVNKLGHALHELDPDFEAFSRDVHLGNLARSLGMQDPRIVQSMMIFKQPAIGGEVRLHQDASFLLTEPSTVLGLWFALEDATVENGCLQVIPAGHRGPLRQRFARTGATSADYRELDATPFDHAAVVPLEVPRGTLVCLHGHLPHGSAPNHSAASRHAYAMHVIDGQARWLEDNWLRRSRPAVPFYAS
ncbi:MAG: phytanoyl-CoA dioxygenase family protein [Pseudomonadota bacterium]